MASLQFGFWTHLFQPYYEEKGGFMPKAIKSIFPNLVKSKHNRKELKHNLDVIRSLRNDVFHHDRIIHWKDFPKQHTDIIRTIGWINLELREMAEVLDRFTSIHSAGIEPWKEKIQMHWPKETA